MPVYGSIWGSICKTQKRCNARIYRQFARMPIKDNS